MKFGDLVRYPGTAMLYICTWTDGVYCILAGVPGKFNIKSCRIEVVSENR